jgi:hypothetical protein
VSCFRAQAISNAQREVGVSDRRRQDRAWPAIVVLTLAIPVGYVMTGNSRSLVPWGLCLLMTAGGTSIARRGLLGPAGMEPDAASGLAPGGDRFVSLTPQDVLDAESRFLPLGLLSYLSLSIIGLALITIYRSLYDLDFGPFTDDSYYYLNIQTIAEGEAANATGYEYLMALWYLCLSGFQEVPGPLDLLPLNWSIGALVVCLSYRLAMEVTGKVCPFWLAFLALIGNSIFTDAIANLYRDGLMLLALLVSMIATIRNQYPLGILGAIGAGLVRIANGALALFFVAFCASRRIRMFRQYPGLLLVLTVSLVAVVLILDDWYHLATYARSFRISEDVEGVGVFEAIQKRSEWLDDADSDPASLDLTKRMFHSGPIGYALMLPISALSPIRVKEVFCELEPRMYLNGTYTAFRAYGLNPAAVFDGITVVLWSVLGPYLVLGFVEALRGRIQQPGVFLQFLLSVLMVTFVSFQPRHRTAFLVMYPMLLTLAYYRLDRQRWIPRLRWAFVIAIFVINIVPHLLSRA